MQATIIGYGSIGERHARILHQLGAHITIVSKRNDTKYDTFATIRNALQLAPPAYVVIANKTADHHSTLTQLDELHYKGKILIEKPLFHKPYSIKKDYSHVFVGYNLRFHPVLLKLKSELANKKIVSAVIYAGQYLPSWRPNTDYRTSYSANKDEGGGVLRDLSHELDYMLWLFGQWQSVVAHGGHYSHLDINSDDLYSMMLTTEHCSNVLLQVNYLDRIIERKLIIHTEEATYHADLINNTLKINDTLMEFHLERNDTYTHMHQAIIAGDSAIVCSFAEGMEVMKLIEAIEQSALEKRWVKNV